MIRALVLASCLLIYLSNMAQELETSAGISLTGIFASEDVIPAWFYTNNHTALNPMTNFAGQLDGALRYMLSDNAFIEGGDVMVLP